MEYFLVKFTVDRPGSKPLHPDGFESKIKQIESPYNLIEHGFNSMSRGWEI
jgi:hypothetical protein